MVRIETDYKLKAGVRFPAAKDIFVHSVQTDSEAHPASYLTDTGRSFPGNKTDGT
jgi:hypothetical protein